jgi:hypothetical protein
VDTISRLKPHWTINPEKLAEAVEFLGLEYPVLILPTEARYVGKYHGIGHFGPGAGPQGYAEPTHVCTLSHDLGPWSASRCAWHELTHAMQAESFMPKEDVNGEPRWKIGIREFTKAYAKEASRTGGYSSANGAASQVPGYSYTNISFEQECNDNMPLAGDCAICDGDRTTWTKFRIDHVNKGKAQTFYISAATKLDALDFVKNNMKDWGCEKWHDYRIYPVAQDDEKAAA